MPIKILGKSFADGTLKMLFYDFHGSVCNESVTELQKNVEFKKNIIQRTIITRYSDYPIFIFRSRINQKLRAFD